MLGINRKATYSEIERAYEKYMKLYDSQFGQGIDDLKMAYRILSNEESRKEYDLFVDLNNYPWERKNKDDERQEEIERKRRERHSKKAHFHSVDYEDFYSAWSR